MGFDPASYTLAMLLWLLGLGPVPAPSEQPLAPAPPPVVLPRSECGPRRWPDDAVSLRVLPAVNPQRGGDVFLLGWSGFPGGWMAWFGFDGRFHVRQSPLAMCEQVAPW